MTSQVREEVGTRALTPEQTEHVRARTQELMDEIGRGETGAAERIGVSQQVVWRFMKQREPPGLKTARHLAEALGLSLQELLDGVRPNPVLNELLVMHPKKWDPLYVSLVRRLPESADMEREELEGLLDRVQVGIQVARAAAKATRPRAKKR